MNVTHSASTEPRTHVFAHPLISNALRKDVPALMRHGVKAHQQTVEKVLEAKHFAALSGAYFLAAKRASHDGDWLDICAANGVVHTTANRYIAWAEYCIALGKRAIGTEDESRALERGCMEVMDSPRAWTSLMRYAGLLEKQGQYDPERYAARKTEQPAQLEFDFGAIMQSVRVISKITEDDVGRSNLVALRAELAAALASVDHKLRTLNGTIEA